MFTEFKCGCIFSVYQGRVRVCPTHPNGPGQADGTGGALPPKLPKVIRRYPANGIEVLAWNGGK